MMIEIPAAAAAHLVRMAEAAGISNARWVRAAIEVARQDPHVAQRIIEAAPPSEHGGARPGAGRPRGSRSRRATDEEDDDVHEDHPRD